ncbi:MAG: RsmB/NOP family class I SAM-dependent RNA methyltransferase [Myxococcaceae bacterium]|nr:RsmB/NOP family class I SAM-dependent RNA methyltransferase [Myxococcaceae bacterium]
MEAAIREVLSGAAAERVLDVLFRADRSLSADRRAAVAEAVFGVGLWRRRLAWQLGADDADPSGCDPRALLFSLMRDLAGVAESAAADISGLELPPPPRGVPDSWRVRESFPDWLADLLEAELGPHGAADFAAAVNVRGPVVLRANRLVCADRDALAAALQHEGVPTVAGRWAPDALIVTGTRPNLLGLEANRNASFEVQDEGSQLLGELVGAAPGMRVLDFCAGAGGKSVQLASILRNRGELHAWDVDTARLERLRVRAQRAGATCVRIHRAPPPSSLLVDAVLVDAPCSELGPLRRGPDVRWRLDPGVLRSLPQTQQAILTQAQAHVRPGGRLVYATCTIHRAENEDVVAWFERTFPDFERATPDAPSDFIGADRLFRALPHVHDTDGFFAAVWTRTR